MVQQFLWRRRLMAAAACRHVMARHAPAPPLVAAPVAGAVGRPRPHRAARQDQWPPHLPRRHPHQVEEAGATGRPDEARGRHHLRHYRGPRRQPQSISESVVTMAEMQKEHKILKKMLGGLLHQNGILKRAFLIHHNRLKEYQEMVPEQSQFKEIVDKYQQQIKALEVQASCNAVEVSLARALVLAYRHKHDGSKDSLFFLPANFST